jgi:hypothetical protein
MAIKWSRAAALSRRQRALRRRQRLLSAVGVLLFSSVAVLICCLSPRTADKPMVNIYMPENCAECVRWVKYLERRGFRTTTSTFTDVREHSVQCKVPVRFQAPLCATVGGFILGGFVPAHEIHLLVDHKFGRLVKGLVVSGKPPGAPGIPTAVPKPFTVYALLSGGMLRPVSTYNDPLHPGISDH